MVLISDNVTNDVRLSDAEVGLFTRISGYPDNWHLSVNGLVKIRAGNRNKDGATATRKRLQNLEKYGYLIRGRVRSKDGTLSSDTVYIVVGDPENIYGAVIEDLKKANILIISEHPESFEHERSFIYNYKKSGAATTAPDFFDMPPAEQRMEEETPGRNLSRENGISVVTWEESELDDIAVEFGWKDGGKVEEEVFHSENNETSESQNPRSQPKWQNADVGENAADITSNSNSTLPITYPSIHPTKEEKDLSGCNKAEPAQEQLPTVDGVAEQAGRTDGWMESKVESTIASEPFDATRGAETRSAVGRDPEPIWETPNQSEAKAEQAGRTDGWMESGVEGPVTTGLEQSGENRSAEPREDAEQAPAEQDLRTETTRQARSQRKRPIFSAIGFGRKGRSGKPEAQVAAEEKPTFMATTPSPEPLAARRPEGTGQGAPVEAQRKAEISTSEDVIRDSRAVIAETSWANGDETTRKQRTPRETAERMMQSAVNRNRLRSAADIEEITRRVKEISEKGHSLEDIEGAWNDVQERLTAEGRQQRFFPQLLKWLAYDAIQEIRKREREMFEKTKSGNDKASLAIRYACLVEDDPTMAQLDAKAHALASEARYDESKASEAKAAKETAWNYFYVMDGQR